MTVTDYDEICSENLKCYGTRVSVYAKVLLADAYKERTHFLFELIQNAEDACLKGQDSSSRFYVRMDLFSDRFEFRHNGSLFDANDVRGICGIVNTTKNHGNEMIGKFGIGFKSVYAFTNSPEIYSGQEAFKISDYVSPRSVKKRDDLKENETLIVLRFDKESPDSNTSYNEIKDKLERLDYTTLLFLKRIEEISWTVEGKKKVLTKKQEFLLNNNLRISIKGPDRTDDWLLFSEKVGDESESSVRVAYKVRTEGDSLASIIPVSGAKVFNYFETDVQTNLKFQVDGPFHTTPSRDNIKNEAWNSNLIQKASCLVGESLDEIKQLGFLNVDFLNMLPIETGVAEEDKFIYSSFFESVKKKLMNCELLPTMKGFVAPTNAAISRSDDLRELLNEEQMMTLMGKKVEWLNSSVTQDNYPNLRRYLMNDLNVPEIDPESFARKVEGDFFVSQSDSWIIQFYSFLKNQKSLWDNSARSPVLRKKPIIRLFNNSQIEPFYDDDRPKANLPTNKLSPDLNVRFNAVKEIIVQDKAAREFLLELGLKEIGRETVILDYLLPRYQQSGNEISEEENLRDIKWIATTLSQGTEKENSTFIQRIKSFPFLFATNAGSASKAYRVPTNVFLPQHYSRSSELESFYDGYENAWFLDDRYIKDPEIDVKLLVCLGCKTEIELISGKADFNGFVIVHNSWGSHKRGIDGFDPKASIVGLQHALDNINFERARILWSLLARNYKLISGTIESSSSNDFKFPKKTNEYSAMGDLLKISKWLPVKDGSFRKPSEIEITDIQEGLLSEIQESPLIAEKLGIKDDVDKRALQKYPILKEMLSLSPDQLKIAESKIKEIIENLRLDENPVRSKEDISSLLRARLNNEYPQVSTDPQNGRWKSATESEEATIREHYAEETQKKVDNSKFKLTSTLGKSYSAEDFDPKTFLNTEYNGHCQICNTRLDLGGGIGPYFDTFRLIKESVRTSASESEFNVICLCPNCHALAEYGSLDLSQLSKSADEIMSRNKIAEPIDERNGDFYTFDITLAGRPSKIYYTQRHIMQVISVLTADRN